MLNNGLKLALQLVSMPFYATTPTNTIQTLSDTLIQYLQRVPVSATRLPEN